jgi:lia operon protein LiaG
MKLGKWLLIFGIIAIVSAIAFGCTVVAFGVSNADYGISFLGHNILGGLNMGKTGIIIDDNGTRITYDFEKNNTYSGELDGTGLSDINFELASCRTTVTAADTNKVSLTYTTSGTPVEFVAECRNGVLKIEEKVASFLNFGINNRSELTLTVPRTLYNSVNIELASGSVTAPELTTDAFRANVASGSLELGMYSEKIDINLASGKVNINNCTENAADRIKLNVASGHISMSGFKASSTDVDIASGHVDLTDISGKVSGQLASGKLVLTYAEWNNDLDVELMSGNADVTLPAGSGVNADFEKLSGSMSIDLDGSSEKLSKNSRVTVGGSNIHNVKAETASGSISIHN